MYVEEGEVNIGWLCRRIIQVSHRHFLSGSSPIGIEFFSIVIVSFAQTAEGPITIEKFDPNGAHLRSKLPVRLRCKQFLKESAAEVVRQLWGGALFALKDTRNCAIIAD